MKFGPGQEYDLLSIEAWRVITTLPAYSRHKQEVSRFLTHDLNQYLGQYILYGTVKAHGFRVAKGMVEVKVRPGCFVVLLKENRANTERLVKMLKGLPWGICQGSRQELVPIVNWSTDVPGISDGRTKDRDKLLARAVKVINFYYYWKEHDALPPWFVEAKRKAEVKRQLDVSSGNISPALQGQKDGKKSKADLWIPGRTPPFC